MLIGLFLGRAHMVGATAAAALGDKDSADIGIDKTIVSNWCCISLSCDFGDPTEYGWDKCSWCTGVFRVGHCADFILFNARRYDELLSRPQSDRVGDCQSS